ncbi:MULTISPECIES: hypothetical protein [unclassified Aureimonas]|uniref:hypothetical protein n=1 Tax=unclassified Aureimonas TaxID=2615206 RepID=UPI0007001231|nr:MULTISPECIES: hypothetical protein [unclassified Aureimonas]KQT64254.1 hypothetical protein ASG62_04485 [Aureimonas sp. Leaf427]KQT81443.1 hypothetical protein ASG54_01750 [Aureimonas sp. Leaf460]
MDFMNLLKSVEELLYEVVSWLLFYPLTFWKCVRHPIRMMAYAEAELAEGPKARYAAALSPPIFLFLTLILAHFIELRFGMPERELTGALGDQRNLLLFRAVLFSLFPLILAVQRVHRLDQALTRETLRPAFYSQCYVAAPFALSFDLAITIGRHASPAALGLGAAIFLCGLVWYVAVLARWFMSHLGMGPLAAVLRVAGTVVLGSLAFILVALATAIVVKP